MHACARARQTQPFTNRTGPSILLHATQTWYKQRGYTSCPEYPLVRGPYKRALALAAEKCSKLYLRPAQMDGTAGIGALLCCWCNFGTLFHKWTELQESEHCCAAGATLERYSGPLNAAMHGVAAVSRRQSSTAVPTRSDRAQGGR